MKNISPTPVFPHGETQPIAFVGVASSLQLANTRGRCSLVQRERVDFCIWVHLAPTVFWCMKRQPEGDCLLSSSAHPRRPRASLETSTDKIIGIRSEQPFF